MFVRHQAEITVMQFTGHSHPVHQSMTVQLDFTLSHIVSQARLRDLFPELPLECVTSFRCITLKWHVWPGRRSIYNIKTERNKINQVLTYISRNNITELKEQIDAGAKLVCEKTEIHSKSTKEKSKQG